MRNSLPLSVDTRDAVTLRGWIADEPAGSAAARRARIVLLAAGGLGPSAVADELGCSKQTVITWRERYRTGGVAGLRDAPRSGRPATVDAAAIVNRTLDAPPPPAARWSTRLLAAELGISNATVAGVWRTWGITPGDAGGVRLATEPVLDVPIAAVVGLYVDPDHRLVALVTGPPAATDGPDRRRPDLGMRLGEIDPGTRAGDGRTADLAAFFSRLEHVGPSRLLAETAGEPVRRWAATRPGAVVHVVPPELSWARLSRVACALAGASTGGAASVAELRSAVAAHLAGGPFAWTPAVAIK